MPNRKAAGAHRRRASFRHSRRRLIHDDALTRNRSRFVGPDPSAEAGETIRRQAAYTHLVNTLARITADPEVMGGRPCIRGLRVTVGTIVGLIASGRTREEILRLYPYLESDDISEALAYAAWRSDEFEVPISSS